MRGLLLALLGSMVAVLLAKRFARFAPEPGQRREGRSPDVSEGKSCAGRSLGNGCGLVPGPRILLLPRADRHLRRQAARASINQACSGWLAALVVSAVVQAVAAAGLRCPQCDARFMLQWTRRAPPRSKSVRGLGGAGAAALDVVLHDEFTCMYCGQRCLLEPPEDR